MGLLAMMGTLGGAAASVDGAATVVFGGAAIIVLAILWMLAVGWGTPTPALAAPQPKLPASRPVPRTLSARPPAARTAAPVTRRRVVVRMPAEPAKLAQPLPMGRVVTQVRRPRGPTV